MCNCNEQDILVDITDNHTDFKNQMETLAHGNWVLLMECPKCQQLWKVDEWDKYQTLYAIKISSQENWEEIDSRSLIEERIIKNRGGLVAEGCMIAECNNNQVKGSAFCAKHMYESGTHD